jgi:DMSO/TMAO reductase YedYZ heme-binding membrane subunit
MIWRDVPRETGGERMEFSEVDILMAIPLILFVLITFNFLNRLLKLNQAGMLGLMGGLCFAAFACNLLINSQGIEGMGFDSSFINSGSFLVGIVLVLLLLFLASLKK